MATTAESSLSDLPTAACESRFTSARAAGEMWKSECGTRASPGEASVSAGYGLQAASCRVLGDVDCGRLLFLDPASCTLSRRAAAAACARVAPAAATASGEADVFGSRTGAVACPEAESNDRECAAAAASGRGRGAGCPSAAAGVMTKDWTEELRAPKRSWRSRVNKNRANTFTFKLVSVATGDPRACTAGSKSAPGGCARALQRVVPPNALRKNRFAKQLPRELLETFTPEDFGIHANLEESVRRHLCDEIYGEAADLLEANTQQTRLLKHRTDPKLDEDPLPQPEDTSHTPLSHSSDLDDDCYFPKDGYDYTQHLVVYSTTRKPHAAEAATSTGQPHEQETQEAPKRTVAGARCREECHVLEALENADDYEELLDDFVTAAQTDETGRVQPIEGEEALLWGESHTAGAEQESEAICERLARLRLEESRERKLGEGEYWTESSDVEYYEDSDSAEAAADADEGNADGARRAVAATLVRQEKEAATALAAAPTDEDFEKVLEEYGDDHIGEVEAEGEEQGSSEAEEEKISSEVEEALDDFLRQQKRGKKLHIFTRDFLMRRSARRLPPQAGAAAGVVLGEPPSSSHEHKQLQRCGARGGRSSKSNDEEVRGDASGNDAGSESVDEEEPANTDEEDGEEEQHDARKYSHKKANDTDIQEMFRRPSRADVEVIKRLAEQQERESQERIARGGEGYSTDEETKERARREEERRWDCDTILTTRSASSWMPRTIALPPPHILKKQLHLLRGAGIGRAGAQGDESGNIKVLPQLVFAKDTTSAAAARSGRRGSASKEGQAQEATAAKKGSLRRNEQQSPLELLSRHAWRAEDAEDHDNTSGSSTAEATPAATADDTARLIEALQSASATDVPPVVTRRPRGETTEERRERKKAVRETQRVAREVKKQNKLLLKEEEKKAAGRRMNTNAYDVKAGVRRVKF